MTHAPMGRAFGVALSAVVMGMAAAPLWAQNVASGIEPHHEYRKRIQNAETPSGLDAGLFGESTSMYDGRTEFRIVDVELPGNSSLPVQVARRLSVELQPQNEISAHDARLLGFGNWDIEVPHISATYPSATGWPATRCSGGSVPGTVSRFSVREHWSGISIHIPGRGDTPMLAYVSGVPKPTDGANYRATTKERDAIDCIAMADGSGGEGYRLTTTNGERYYFNRMVMRTESTLQKSVKVSNGTFPINLYLPRTRYYLLASKVEDRFGNHVQFTYNASGHPTSIKANDGRTITISYAQGRVSQVQANGRAWSYQYTARSPETVLSKVTLPDSSQWSYAYTGTLLPPTNPPSDDLPNHPWCRTQPTLLGVTYQLTATHPAGARGQFMFYNRRHARSGVHVTECMAQGDFVNPTYVRGVPEIFDVMSLGSKSITGPGLPAMTWDYDFGGIFPGFWGSPTEAPNYPCTTCVKTKTVTVIRPDDSVQQLTFGVLYRVNDGRQLGEKILDASGKVLSTTTTDYISDAAAASQPFANEYGGILGAVNDPASVWVRPVIRTSTVQDGSTHSTETNAFDAFARTVKRTRRGPSGSIREQIDFHDLPSRWVMGQARRITNLDNGVVLAEAAFDGNAMPIRTYAFGRLTQTRTYNADGTIASVADGAGKKTTLSSWKRGLPTQIRFADQTTNTLSVDNNGWVTSVTDENGFATGYGYDPMGRVASVTYPSGDSTGWSPTTRTFVPVAAQEYGLPAGHWTQTVATGSARKKTYYDAFWRPVLVREFDSNNQSGTQRFQRFAYDVSGNKVFESYHGTGATLEKGNWTEYDALNRKTAFAQDSESGVLVTVMDYLSGGRMAVTDPLGRKTTTTYQTFDKPSQESPTLIQRPGGVNIQITRDVFGKPTAITQKSTDGTTTLTRRYVYDGFQQLCKSIEPETGTSAVAYDAAGNISWTAAGLALPSLSGCDVTAAQSSGRRVDRTYDARNRLKTLVFPDGRGNQTWTYTPDGKASRITTQNGASTPAVVNSYTYNKRRLLVSESASVPGSHTWSLGYGYDGNGALSSLQYPSGLVVSLAPNALGQPTRAGSFATGVSYYPNGVIKQFLYGNGHTFALTQNARMLPQRARSPGVLDHTYAYDAVGNVLSIADGIDSTRSKTMVYDNLDRLTRATSAAFGSDGVFRYTYDALDNIRSAKLAGIKDHNYWYDEKNRLTNVQASNGSTVQGLSYDVQGNVVVNNGERFDFDFGNRLREAQGKESYAYDAHGRRVLNSAPAGNIASFYDAGGVLRRQDNLRTGRSTEYINLSGSLVARSVTVLSPPVPVIQVPAYSNSGIYTITWNKVALASHYELQEQQEQGAWSALFNGNAQSHEVTGRTAGVYSYRVRACSASGDCSGWSAAAAVNVERAPTGSPTVAVAAISPNGSYSVSWTAAEGATSYRLDERVASGVWIEVQDAAGLSASFSAKPANTYSYRVRACNAAGCGPYSAVVATQVIYTPTVAPKVTAPASNTTGSFSVSWTSVSGATRYPLEQRSNSGAWVLKQDTAAVSRAVSGATYAVYDYRVRACNAVGCSPYSSIASVNVVLAPRLAPTLSGGGTSTTGSYTVSWTAVTWATSYTLEQQLNSGTWTQIQSGSSRQASLSGRADGSYRYRVKACNSAGCSAWSASVSVVVKRPPPVPATPTLKSVLYRESLPGQITYMAGWTAVADVTRYELIGPVNCTNTARFPGCSATAMGPPSTLKFSVRACNANGCSPYSNLVQAEPYPDF